MSQDLPRRGSRDRDDGRSVPPMSMTNEDHNAEWELGDAITIHLDPEEPEAAQDETVDDDAD